MTNTVKQLKCADLVAGQWKDRQKDLIARDGSDREFEGLSFDYVAPHTFKDQTEGYWQTHMLLGHLLSLIHKDLRPI